MRKRILSVRIGQSKGVAPKLLHRLLSRKCYDPATRTGQLSPTWSHVASIRIDGFLGRLFDPGRPAPVLYYGFQLTGSSLVGGISNRLLSRVN